MGLYSTIYSSYEKLGPDFIGEFQTKNLESLMDEYWLSPKGELFFIDYKDCFTVSQNKFPKNFLDTIERRPTGTNAKMTPVNYTGELTMYKSYRGEWIETELMFEDGKVSLILEQEIIPLP